LRSLAISVEVQLSSMKTIIIVLSSGCCRFQRARAMQTSRRSCKISVFDLAIVGARSFELPASTALREINPRRSN
jgi:hypothetical protein